MAANGRKHPQFVLPVPKEISPGSESESTPESTTSSSESAPAAGAELHFLQWTFPSPTQTCLIFTHLSEYKLRSEYAVPHTTLTIHTDLLESHGIALLDGVIGDKGSAACVSPQDATVLLWGLQAFYGPGLATAAPAAGESSSGAAKAVSEAALRREKREVLLRAFTSGDVEAFSVEALLEEVERLV